MKRPPIATVLIREAPEYRKQAFVSGLRQAGFDVRDKLPPSIQSDDVLVIWNRARQFFEAAKAYEDIGAKVLVVENGWIGRDEDGRQLYAIAVGHHNGAGTWHVGDEDRWSRLRVRLQPWRKRGNHILVLPQRGIGEAGVAMPKNWIREITRRLDAVTKRPVKVREHPGNAKPLPSLDPDFEDCWAAVTWASGAGIKAIVAGIPVFHCLEQWIGAPAAKFGVDDLENPFLDDRMPMLHRLSWAQWKVEEIQRGEPFKWLLT